MQPKLFITAALLLATTAKAIEIEDPFLPDSTGKEFNVNTGKAYPGKTTMSFRESVVNLANQEYQQWRNGAVLREHDSAALSLVRKYWVSLGWNPKDHQIQDSLWQEKHPWSAVFVSWIMKEAGAGQQFKYSTRHSDYIVWAKKNAVSNKSTAIFTAYDICDPRAAWPEPGDLLCKNRDGKLFSLKTITAKDISHCDIVVEVNKESGTITTIGGNLRNTVNKRVIKLDKDGFIDRSAWWLITDEEAGNPSEMQKDFFAIIKIQESSSLLVTRSK